MDDTSGDLQTRTRITLLVPAPTELSPHDDVLDWLFTEWNEVFGGITFSQASPGIFQGNWIRPSTGAPEPERNILVIADANLAADDPDFPDLLRYLARTKRALQRDLRQYVIWMNIHSVSRITAFDPADFPDVPPVFPS